MTARRRVCESLAPPHALPVAHPYTRLYPCGWRCARHTPNALAGRPEPPPGPGWPIHRQPPPDTAEAAVPTGAEHHEDTP